MDYNLSPYGKVHSVKRTLEYLPCNNVDGKKLYMPLKNAAPDLERYNLKVFCWFSSALVYPTFVMLGINFSSSRRVIAWIVDIHF